MSNLTDQRIMRERRVYGETLAELQRVLYGFGIEPKSVKMERCEITPGGRVLFDVMIDGRGALAQSMTVEQIQVMTEAWETSKALMMEVWRRKKDIKGLYVKPYDMQLMHTVANDTAPAVRQMAASRQDAVDDAARSVKRGPRSEPTVYKGNTDSDSINRPVASRISVTSDVPARRSMRRQVKPWVPTRKNPRPRFGGNGNQTS